MARQRILEQEGLHVLRFTNDEVLRDLEGVLDRLRAWLEASGRLTDEA